MQSDIVMIDYSRPLAQRAEARRHVGPYRWTPATPGTGRGFYQAQSGLSMDARGSTLDLRLDYANTHIDGGGWRLPVNYWADPEGFDTLTPIIARLPHGRGFLAGWTMGPGMLASLDSCIHETEADAARAAFDVAKSDAERMRAEGGEPDQALA